MPGIVIAHHGEGPESRPQIAEHFAERHDRRRVARDVVADEIDEIDLLVIDNLHGAPDELLVTEIVVVEVAHHRDLQALEGGMGFC